MSIQDLPNEIIYDIVDYLDNKTYGRAIRSSNLFNVLTIQEELKRKYSNKNIVDLVIKNDLNGVMYLVENNPNIFITTAIGEAARYGRAKIFKYLFARDNKDAGYFIQDIKAGANLELIQFLLESGTINKHHTSAAVLPISATKGYLDIIKYHLDPRDTRMIVELISIAAKHEHYNISDYLINLGIIDNVTVQKLLEEAKRYRKRQAFYNF